MNQKTIEDTLSKIWAKHSKNFNNNELNKVIERGFVYALPRKSDILIAGINPSFQEKNSHLPFFYTFDDAKHPYFTKLRKVVLATGSNQIS